MLYYPKHSPWSVLQVRADTIAICWCRPATQDRTPRKRLVPSSLCTTSSTMKAMSARPPVRGNSHLMILKSFQPHLQLMVVDPRAPDLAPAFRNGQTRTFPLQINGLPTPTTILTCVIQTHSALKSGSRRSAAMRCRSIGHSGLVHSVHQSDQSFSGSRSGCPRLCKHATETTFDQS